MTDDTQAQAATEQRRSQLDPEFFTVRQRVPAN